MKLAFSAFSITPTGKWFYFVDALGARFCGSVSLPTVGLECGSFTLESGSTLSTCCAIIARLVGGIARHLLPIAQELASATVLDA